MKTRAFGAAVFLFTSMAGAQPPIDLVRVVVDMDTTTPGIQSNLRVPPGTVRVAGIPVYIVAATGSPHVLSIGFIGGLDRGISFGHTPHAANVGTVTHIEGHPQFTVNPQCQGWVENSGQGIFPLFAGPEVQYLEINASEPAPIPAEPRGPVLTVDITLGNAQSGDVFAFYLADAVAANWSGERGAFTTRVDSYIDTGGDWVPDMTQTVLGLDPDIAVTVPPASFRVDFIDGDPITGGPATITILCAADFNADRVVNSADFFDFLTAFFIQAPEADFNRSGAVDSQDFFDFLAAFFAGCP